MASFAKNISVPNRRGSGIGNLFFELMLECRKGHTNPKMDADNSLRYCNEPSRFFDVKCDSRLDVMNRIQAIFSIILAIAVGYACGYFTNIVRFPLQHRQPDLMGKSSTATPKPFIHPILAQVENARHLYEAGKKVEAQKLLLDQLLIYPQAPEARSARELLGTINTDLFFSDANLYGKTEYVVQRGDSLARIANRLNSSPEMIVHANALDSTIIHPGERLLIPDGDFTLTIDVPRNRVVVHHGEGFFKQYPIQSIALPPSSQPRLVTKVTATTLWKNGERVSATAKDVDDATPWVHLARSGYTLYGVSEEGNVEPGAVEVAEHDASPLPSASPVPGSDPDIPPSGIALLKDDLEELRLLLRRGTPVTILREKK